MNINHSNYNIVGAKAPIVRHIKDEYLQLPVDDLLPGDMVVISPSNVFDEIELLRSLKHGLVMSMTKMDSITLGVKFLTPGFALEQDEITLFQRVLVRRLS